MAAFKREGLAGLVRKSRIDSGERRTVTPRLCEVIEGLALEKPPLPLTSVHRQAKQFAHLVGEPAPSYWVVRDIVLSLPSDLRKVAQQGSRKFGELLTRPLTQIERVLSVNEAPQVSVQTVEAARDSLVIGQA